MNANMSREITQIWSNNVANSAVNAIEIVKLNGNDIRMIVSTNDKEVRSMYFLSLQTIS